MKAPKFYSIDLDRKPSMLLPDGTPAACCLNCGNPSDDPSVIEVRRCHHCSEKGLPAGVSISFDPDNVSFTPSGKAAPTVTFPRSDGQVLRRSGGEVTYAKLAKPSKPVERCSRCGTPNAGYVDNVGGASYPCCYQCFINQKARDLF